MPNASRTASASAISASNVIKLASQTDSPEPRWSYATVVYVSLFEILPRR